MDFQETAKVASSSSSHLCFSIRLRMPAMQGDERHMSASKTMLAGFILVYWEQICCTIKGSPKDWRSPWKSISVLRFGDTVENLGLF